MVLVNKDIIMHTVNHHQGRRRPLVRDAAMLAMTFFLGYQAKSALDGNIAAARVAPASNAAARTERDARHSIVPTRDPYLEPLDCIQLLNSYRTGEVQQLKDHSDASYPIHKSYVRLTATKVPFYVTTNDGKIDRMRVSLFETGEYYETIMTSSMQSILEEELQRSEGSGRRRKRPIVLDVGGNVGFFSLLAAAHGAEVFAFEPNVVNMVRFCESLTLNGWAASPNPAANYVHPFLKGVSDEHGTKQPMYKVDRSNPGSFSFSKETADKDGQRYYGKADVLEGDPLQLISLDALAEDQGWITAKEEERNYAPISILKIDVEGLESKVLRGAKKLLKSGRVKNIFMELKDTEGEALWAAMFDILLESGYALYKLGDHLGPTHPVSTKYSNGKEAASGIARLGFTNANIWLRIAK